MHPLASVPMYECLLPLTLLGAERQIWIQGQPDPQ